MKYYRLTCKGSIEKSPSMRREWIEIQQLHLLHQYTSVSLHAEGVD